MESIDIKINDQIIKIDVLDNKSLCYPTIYTEVTGGGINKINICIDFLKNITKKLISYDGNDLNASLKAIQRLEHGTETIIFEKKIENTNINKLILSANKLYLQYVKNARKPKDNNLRLYPPMIPHDYGYNKQAEIDTQEFEKSVFIQRKYNGIRAVSTKYNDIIIYSKDLKQIHGLSNIKEEIAKLLKTKVNYDLIITELKSLNYIDKSDKNNDLMPLFNDVYLDGKIYNHNWDAGKITNEMNKLKDTKRLRFCIFDIFYPTVRDNGIKIPYTIRSKILSHMFSGKKYNYIHNVDTYPINRRSDMKVYMDQFLSEGYVGMILRRVFSYYEYSYDNHKSYGVLKVKPLLDDEFNVTGFDQINGAVVWQCLTKKSYSFAIEPKYMSLNDRKNIYIQLSNDKSKFVKFIKNKKIAMEYRFIDDETGIPHDPIMIGFKSNATTDPIDFLMK
jgi:hypothetical protein